MCFIFLPIYIYICIYNSYYFCELNISFLNRNYLTSLSYISIYENIGKKNIYKCLTKITFICYSKFRIVINSFFFVMPQEQFNSNEFSFHFRFYNC